MSKFHLYRPAPATMKKDVIWSVAGNTLFAMHSVLMLAVVSHFCGLNDAGVFSLTYSISQMMYLIGCFDLVNVLVTDSRGEFNRKETLFFRLCTIAFMVLVSAVFAKLQDFTGQKLQTFGVLILYMSVLALAEYCECNLHHNGYLYLASQSLALDIGLCSLTFGLVAYFTGSILLAVGGMCAVIVLWILFYDLPWLKATRTPAPHREFRWSAVRSLLGLCLPLLLMHLTVTYIINSPKLAIDVYLPIEYQSFFGYVMMPASCINLLNIFALRPQLINLAGFYNRKEYRPFTRVVMGLVLWNAAVTVVVLLGGYLLGIPILSLIYGVDLSGMEGVLCVCLVGGCFYSFATLFDAVATSMRCHRWNLIAYIAAFLCGVTIIYPMVERWQLWGAVFSYAFLMLIMAVGSGTVVFTVLSRQKKKNPGCSL